jgi:hypothetical protein
MSDQTYCNAIDLSRLQSHWPDGRDIPQLIVRVAELIQDWPWGSIGYFSMPGSRMNDHWIELGADLWDQFGLFIKLADGSEIGLWFHEGAVSGAEPVLLIGSEGDARILAPNLKYFMTYWAQGDGPLDLAFSIDEETPERIAERQDFGDRLLMLIQTEPDPPIGADSPDPDLFMTAYGDQVLAQLAVDPVMIAIAKVMDAHVPHGQESWHRVGFSIAVAGPRIEVLAPLSEDGETRVPFPECEALIPLLLQARDDRVIGKHHLRGLWHSAILWLYSTGRVYIAASWEEEPKFESGPVTQAELQVDLDRFPLGLRWREPWMNALL